MWTVWTIIISNIKGQSQYVTELRSYVCPAKNDHLDFDERVYNIQRQRYMRQNTSQVYFATNSS